MHDFASSRRALLGFACAAALLGCVETHPGLSPVDECEAGQWCWVRGRPHVAMGGASIDTVFVLGLEGGFARWRDGTWESQPVPTRATLTSGWVRDASEAWVSDADGRAWQRVDGRWFDRSPEALVARLHGTADGALFAEVDARAGAHGAVEAASLLRWEDGAWVEAAPRPEYCLGGDYLPRARDDIWSVGWTCSEDGDSAAQVRRYDGAGWSPVGELLPHGRWFPEFLRSETAVRVRTQGTFEWTGETWARVEVEGYPQDLAPDEAATPDTLGYTRFPTSLGCSRAWRLDADHAWCFGRGQIHHRAVDGWRPTLPEPFTATRPAAEHASLPPALWAGSDVVTAWGSGPSDHYAVRGRERSLERFDGAAWQPLGIDGVYDVQGVGPRDLWLATEDGLLRWRDGETLRVELATPPRIIVAATGQSVLVALEDQLLRVSQTSRSYDVEVLYQAPERWTVVDAAAGADARLWVSTQGPPSRPFTPGATLSFDGAWREILPSASSLAGDGEAAWLLEPDGVLRRLTGTPLAVQVPVASHELELSVHDTDPWLTSQRQALRWTSP